MLAADGGVPMWARVRIVIAWMGALLGLAVVGVGVGLGWAHAEIRSTLPRLPEVSELSAAAPQGAVLPIRLFIVNTASQPTTRAGVLEPSLDPDPDAPYTMSVPAFALEWPDGRIFLIDLGMDREAASAFGAPSELLFDAAPMSGLGSVAAQLGDAAARVAGVAFTHLHTDHTQGALVLCASQGRAVPLYQGSLQAEQRNYTTRPGAAHVEEAGCLDTRVLEGEGLLPVPGFDGLAVIPVAGHTPGSQIFVARMDSSAGGRTWVFTGDAVNHIDGVRLNLPKPDLYSLLVVPEDPTRLEAVRVMLAQAAALPDVDLLVSHDQDQLVRSGVPSWPASGPSAR